MTTIHPISIDHAHTSAIAWWGEHELLSNVDHASAIERLDTIRAAADDLDITDVHALFARARQVITKATGSDTTKFAGQDESDERTALRNTIATLAFGAGATTNPYTLISDLATMPTRSGGRRRALRDDEIILMRYSATHTFNTITRSRRQALQYAFAESGAHPSETTEITPFDLDDPRLPTAVSLQGFSVTQSRTVALNGWAAGLIARGADQQLASRHGASLPMRYRGDGCRDTASASASGNLSRAMQRVGILTVEPTAITRWRIKHELDTNGPHAALALLGRNKAHDHDGPTNLSPVYDFLDAAPPVISHRPTDRPRRSFRCL